MSKLLKDYEPFAPLNSQPEPRTVNLVLAKSSLKLLQAIALERRLSCQMLIYVFILEGIERIKREALVKRLGR